MLHKTAIFSVELIILSYQLIVQYLYIYWVNDCFRIHASRFEEIIDSISEVFTNEKEGFTRSQYYSKFYRYKVDQVGDSTETEAVKTKKKNSSGTLQRAYMVIRDKLYAEGITSPLSRTDPNKVNVRPGNKLWANKFQY